MSAIRSGNEHPTTVFLSVHKGASTFLADDLAPAMTRVFRGLEHVPFHALVLRGRPAEELALPPVGVVTTRVYPMHYDDLVERPVPAAGRFADKKLVMLRRDPRDVACSYYYSWAYSHQPPPGSERREKFFARRKALLELGPPEGIFEYSARPAIRQFLTTIEFLERYPQTLLTTYETLVTDFPAWLDAVAEHLGWSQEERERVGRGLEREVAPPPREDPYRHKRRVTPGAWRDHFEPKLERLFERKLGRRLADAGYEW